MKDLGKLILRATFGGLIAGHGAQKLFGAYGGPGLEGTAGFMEKLGLRPPHQWAMIAGGSEFLGGVLTTLGMFHPVGPLMTLGPMTAATMRAHAGKPIWGTSGGAELPVTNMAIAAALILAGPGRLSFDRIFGTRAPLWMLGLAIGGLGYGLYRTVPAELAETATERLGQVAEGGMPSSADEVRERVAHIAA